MTLPGVVAALLAFGTLAPAGPALGAQAPGAHAPGAHALGGRAPGAPALGARALGGPVAGALLAAGPERVCRIGDKRLTEISGLVATPDGFVVVNDGSDDPKARRIFFLDRRCEVVRTVKYPSRPRDTEDLALGPDGTLWVGDIGDNSETRTTIGLWRLVEGAKSPTLYRLSYPDGAHNAEAMLLDRDGTPIVVTKGAIAAAYVPDGPLRADRATPLRRAGGVTVPMTTTSNPFSLPGRLVITGGAVGRDGLRVMLRTYADAFEYDVPDGDVVRAVTTGKPRIVPLPDEPQGESIAYSADGSTLLTVSEGAGAEVLSYPLPGRPSPPPASVVPSPPTPASDSRPPSAQPAAAVARNKPISTGVLVAAGLLAATAVLLLLIVRGLRRSRR